MNRNPIEWLKDRKPDFGSLSEAELAAILHFSLLWSFFEGRALNTRGNPRRIVALSSRLAREGRLKREVFSSALDYFRKRYVDGDETTEYFDNLNLPKDKEPLVLSVLRAENVDVGDIVGCLLLIVVRLRNNLFHGVKWEYGIHEQFENFTHANEVLMAVLDANRSSGQSSI